MSARSWLTALAALVLGGCAPKVMAIRKVESQPTAAQVAGPKASAEEVAGDVPALRGPADALPLVPPELIPPEPPADPEPAFD